LWLKKLGFLGNGCGEALIPTAIDHETLDWSAAIYFIGEPAGDEAVDGS
jgi:hypothetical protein